MAKWLKNNSELLAFTAEIKSIDKKYKPTYRTHRITKKSKK